jgi:CheY-like chemotaxis protein/predicted nucleic acid-binding protein
VTLIDTSAWIAFLRATGGEADRAVERLLAERARIFTTDTVVAELLAGAGDEDTAHKLGRLLSSVDRCLPAGPLDLERAAYLYRSCRDAGEPVGSLSVCLVAAIALRDGLEVLADDQDLQVLARRSGVKLHGGPPAPEPSLILVVEDEPSAVRMLEGALGGPDRKIVLASTAKEAHALMSREQPDAIVLDLVLPDEDGRNVLANLRRDPKTKDTGVVIVTGKAGPRTREECFALGADDFFDKPFDAHALSKAVELVLAEGRFAAPAPDPLLAPLTLSEVQKLLSARRGKMTGDRLWTVGLVEIDTGREGARPRSGHQGEARPNGELLLIRLLRSVIARLMPNLEEGEFIARWGVDQLVLVTAGAPSGRSPS